LVDLLRDEAWPLDDRRRAIESLARLHDGAAVPGLVAALPVLRTRPAVLGALGQIGDARAVPALVDVLENDRYAHHRAAAVRALGAIGDRRALAAIERAGASDDPPPDVVAATLALGGDALDLARTPPAGWHCEADGCEPGLSALPIPDRRLATASRLLVRVYAPADGGRLVVSSVGQDGHLERPLARGWQELWFDLPERSADAGPQPALHLSADPPDTPVRIRAVLALPRSGR
jgi:hypothetical protein